MREGHGELTWSDGRVYTGQWSNNLINGQGLLVYSNDDAYKRRKYEGAFINDMRHGRGRLDWDTARWYDGMWENDAVVKRSNIAPLRLT